VSSFRQFLLEAKSVKDYRHEDRFDDLAYWPRREDPQFMAPSEGFHFTYHKGDLILHSTDNAVYSSVVATGQIEAKRAGKIKDYKMDSSLWNHFGGKVDLKNKVITVSKESVGDKMRQRSINDVKDIQAAFKNLRKYGVTDDFKLKGVPSPYNGMKMGDFLKHPDPVQTMMGGGGQIMYHGTSKKRWNEKISREGLRPGNTGEIYVDLVKGYSEENVYLATTAKVAEFYGKRQAEKDNDDGYVILKVEVPDSAKLRPDDHFAVFLTKNKDKEHEMQKRSVQELGSLAYRGRIPARFIKMLSARRA